MLSYHYKRYLRCSASNKSSILLQIRALNKPAYTVKMAGIGHLFVSRVVRSHWDQRFIKKHQEIQHCYIVCGGISGFSRAMDLAFCIRRVLLNLPGPGQASGLIF